MQLHTQATGGVHPPVGPSRLSCLGRNHLGAHMLPVEAFAPHAGGGMYAERGGRDILCRQCRMAGIRKAQAARWARKADVAAGVAAGVAAEVAEATREDAPVENGHSKGETGETMEMTLLAVIPAEETTPPAAVVVPTGETFTVREWLDSSQGFSPSGLLLPGMLLVRTDPGQCIILRQGCHGQAMTVSVAVLALLTGDTVGQLYS